MPLPKSDNIREEIHTRQITCKGFKRQDGLWDVDAQIKDVKTYPVDNNFRGQIQPGEPIHEMWIRLTVDTSM